MHSKGVFLWVKKKLYSRFACIVMVVYLILTLIIYIYSFTCSGFLCGVGIIIPIYPSVWLITKLDDNFTLTNNHSFLLGSHAGLITLIVLHALFIYFVMLMIAWLIKKLVVKSS